MRNLFFTLRVKVEVDFLFIFHYFKDKQDNQMSKLSTGDIEQTVQSIETCLDLIQMFYQVTARIFIKKTIIFILNYQKKN